MKVKIICWMLRTLRISSEDALCVGIDLSTHLSLTDMRELQLYLYEVRKSEEKKEQELE